MDSRFIEIEKGFTVNVDDIVFVQELEEEERGCKTKIGIRHRSDVVANRFSTVVTADKVAYSKLTYDQIKKKLELYSL